ncbi:ABC-type transporter Mla MlaB component [Janthinobacterium sp. CG_23.3]|uniref:STAS domain-containing protein n=1 Tax=Janthinobacterium sp. CG_23.3 TaxID=3349634 RepID=UPI0038D4A1EB
MGLFSLFKKSGPEPQPRQRGDDGAAPAAPNSEAQRDQAQLRQREIARATALKIDAIEAAMTFDIFNTPEPAWGSTPPRPPRPPATATLAALDANSTELPSCEPGPAAAVEEIALLYANGQLALAGQMLVDSLADAGADRTLWWMLFDLYQITGQQQQFDSLSIDYASRFETSPPAYAAAAARPADPAYAGAAPTLALAGALDGGIGPAVAQMQRQAGSGPVLRLDLSKVNAVDAAGCALLLPGLRQLQDGRRELIVVGAAELAARVRAIVQVGRRDEGEASWLLLLELLQLLKREKEFEEASMDYCVTFEVSPPPYVAPERVATAAARQSASAASERFMLPALIDAGGALLEAIDAYAAGDGALVFDCSRLLRIEFGAAGLLLARLQRLAKGGKAIEFRDLNHLVAALLRLLAFGDVARIFAHKY